MFGLCYNVNMGNTVGSRELIAFTARKKQKLWIQPRQLDILAGSILGDAYVAPLGKIQIEHSIKQHEYVEWKYQELATISYPSPPVALRHVCRKSGQTYDSLRFWTRQFFRSLRKRFYEGKQKIFPVDLHITPLILAVWYMDDGHYEKKKNRCILATDCFDLNSLKRISRSFQKDLGINPTIRKSGKMAFNSLDCNKFRSVIAPHIIPAMSYKIR